MTYSFWLDEIDKKNETTHSLSVSARVQKRSRAYIHLNSDLDLDLLMQLKCCNWRSNQTIWTFWTCFTDVETAVWVLTETLPSLPKLWITALNLAAHCCICSLNQNLWAVGLRTETSAWSLHRKSQLSNSYANDNMYTRAAVLNLWAADLFPGGPWPWLGMENFFCESRVTIHEKVSSLSSGVRASATYANDFWGWAY